MIAAAGPSALWYLSRGTGLVALLLLTVAVVLGILEVQRWAPLGSPRFVVVVLHRSVSLLVVALLVMHVLTSVLDPFAPIRPLDAVLPFSAAYRPFWLGLGALAFDLVLALTVTSLLRRRLGLRAWRGVHWLAYASWPVALLHGWGTGSDTRNVWMLAFTLGCAAVVLGAVAWRLAGAWSGRPGVSAAAAGAVIALIAFAMVWLPRGPLADGWARRSGTPAVLLSSNAAAVVPAAGVARSRLARPFSAGLRGTLSQGTSADGLAVVDLRMRLTGRVAGVVRVRIAGSPAAGGGVVMRRSAVTLGDRARPGEFQGRIDALDDTSLQALVGSADGRAVRLRLDLTLTDTTVSGTASGRPVNRG